MRLLRALIVTVLAASTLVLVAPAPPASACSCVGGTTATYADGADVVFVGTLTALPAGSESYQSGTVSYPFTVQLVFKGDVPAAVEVASSGSGASCGLEGMEVGTTYAMSAEAGKDDDALTAALCGGSRQASTALVQRLEKLTGPGAVPATTPATPAANPPTASATSTADGPDSAAGNSRAIAYVAGLGILVLGAGAWLVLTRRRRVGGQA
jgi:hypothetical protein